MPEIAAAVVVLGQRGLSRDVVRHALSVSGVATVDLVGLSEDAEAAVVAVLVSPSEDDWEEARRLGARVVVVKDGPVDPVASVDVLLQGADAVVESEVELHDLIEVIAMVAAGDSFVTPQQATEVLGRLRRTPFAATEGPVLTPRELDILASIDRGDAVKQTARQLEISEKTVQNIQSRLFRKLGARNRAQAVARAHETGILPAVSATISD